MNSSRTRRLLRSASRRTALTVLAVLVVVGGLAAAAVATGGDSSTVTRARLERSLPVVFSHLYADQATLLGHDGVTPASLHATAMCDKHGPDVADVGPGGDWICLMGWSDPADPMPPEGYGKFELNVHSNDCWTAAGPSKLTGFITLTDTHGREVTNPVFEFDGCFDPGGDTSATGTSYPSVLNVTSTEVTPTADGTVGVQLSCGTGSDGCRGTLSATAGRTDLGSVPFTVREEATTTVDLPTAVPAGAGEVTITVTASQGVGPSSAVTLPVQR
jgi:hypothetical protein